MASPHYIMEFFPAGSLQVALQKKDLDFLKKNMHSILKQGATSLAYVNASGWVLATSSPTTFSSTRPANFGSSISRWLAAFKR